jgi:3-isopropylmalate dehydrogenase
LRPSQGVLKLRKELGLLQMLDQNISYIIKFISFKARNNDGIDFVVFRELTGGAYLVKKINEEGTKHLI